MRRLLIIPFLLLGLFTYGQREAAWYFENSWNDAEGNYNLSITASPGFTTSYKVEGSYGASFDQNAYNRAVTTNNMDLTSGGLTIEFSFMTFGTSGTNMIVSNRNDGSAKGFSVEYDKANRRILVETDDGTNEGTAYSANNSCLAAGNWNHAVIVWDDCNAQYCRIFINGTKSTVDSIGVSGFGQSNIIAFGSFPSGSGTFYGYVDKAVIYKCAMTDDQAATMYSDRANSEGEMTCPSNDYFHADYYIAPWGDDANPGTYEQPWASWYKFMDANIGAGDTVCVRGGTYYATPENSPGSPSYSRGIYLWEKEGTAANPIVYMAYPGEEPIWDMGNVVTGYYFNDDNFFGLIVTYCSYIEFKGLTFRNLWADGESTSVTTVTETDHSNHITFENCKAYNSRNTGFSVDYSQNITFLNCDAWDHCDSLRAVELLPGNGGYGFNCYDVGSVVHGANDSIFFKGCRAWYCSDDGFVNGTCGLSVMDSCWSFNNGMLEGAGDGFKMGWIEELGADYPLNSIFKNNLAIYNRANGFVTNEDEGSTYVGAMHVYNNIAYHNGYYPTRMTGASACGFNIFDDFGAPDSVHHEWEEQRIFRNNLSYDNEDDDIRISYDNQRSEYTHYTHSNNSWDSGITLSDADFLDLDSATAIAILKGPRQADGSLPDLGDFLKLDPNSDLINAGTDTIDDGTINEVNIIDSALFSGSEPDLGAFETNYGEELLYSAKKWYFDNTGGYDNNSGHSSSEALKSLVKFQALLNADSISAGDTILFKKGERWTEAEINFTGINGTVSNPITITAYGVGDKPVFDGRKTLNSASWASYSGNIYYQTDATLPAKTRYAWVDAGAAYGRERDFTFLGYIFIDDSPYWVSETPNGTDYYLTEDYAINTGSYYIQDNDRSWATNALVGGHIAITTNDWINSTIQITSNSSNRLYLNTSWTDYCSTCGNFGDCTAVDDPDCGSIPLEYKIRNHLSCLDTHGEYYWDYGNSRLYVYFSGNPAATVTKVLSGDSVIYINNSSNININGLEIIGGLNAGIFIENSDSIKIQNNDISYSGSHGVLVVDAENIEVEYNKVANTNHTGIRNLYVKNPTVRFNNIEKIGVNSIAVNRGGSPKGINVDKGPVNSNDTIVYNRIDSTSYSGIEFGCDYTHKEHNSTFIYGNVISRWNLRKTDGAAIYVHWDTTYGANKIIRKNICYDAGYGYWSTSSAPWAPGIYLDGGTWHYTVDSNSTYNASPGIYIHGHDKSDYHIIQRNTAVDFTPRLYGTNAVAMPYGIFMDAYWAGSRADINYNTVRYNYLVPTDSLTSGLHWGADYDEATITGTGNVMNYNNYYTPHRTDNKALSFQRAGYSKIYYTVSSWNSTYGFEANGTINQNEDWTYSDVYGQIDRDDFVKVFMNGSPNQHYFDLGDCSFQDLDGGSLLVDSVLVLPYQVSVLFYVSGNIATIDNEFYAVDPSSGYIEEEVIVDPPEPSLPYRVKRFNQVLFIIKNY